MKDIFYSLSIYDKMIGEKEVYRMNISNIADWFLSKESMTHKKLQKLCYYYVAWRYALYDRAMVDNPEYQAWVHGPVSSDLYSKYNSYGWNSIERKESNVIFSDEEIELLDSV